MKKKKGHKKMTWLLFAVLVVSVMGVVLIAASYRRDDQPIHNLDELLDMMRKDRPRKEK